MQEGMLLIVVVGSVKRRRGRSTGERVVHRYTSLSSTWTTFAWSGSGIQVAGGSFDLSTGCPAGYVSFLSTFFCLFSPKEFRQRRGRFHRGGGVLPSWLQFSSRYSFCCLRENGRINKWHLARGRRKRGGEARGMKRKDEEGEKKIAPSLPFLFFSFLFVVALVQRAGLPTLRSAARPFVVPVLPFVSPARNETPCLWLSVTQWASQIKPCLVSRNGRQGNSDSRCVVGWLVGSFFGGLKKA